MPTDTTLHLSDALPLTCTREGTCCHGAMIRITPWELAFLAEGVGMTPRRFRDRHTADGGTLLRTDGPEDNRGRHACSLYRDGVGCTQHANRPLACRLFPLGRRRNGGIPEYHHPGRRVGCVDLCPEVTALPHMSVAEYLRDQQLVRGEQAHDAYAQILAGLIATAGQMASRSAHLVDLNRVDSALAARAELSAEARARALPTAWFDLLTVPELPVRTGDPLGFTDAHRLRLAQAIATGFALDGSLGDAIIVVATLALHLAPPLGTDPALVVRAFTLAARTPAHA